MLRSILYPVLLYLLEIFPVVVRLIQHRHQNSRRIPRRNVLLQGRVAPAGSYDKVYECDKDEPGEGDDL